MSHLTRQRGMFCYLGLSREQVVSLRERFSIYVVESGRANVAGLTPENVDRVADALAKVTQGALTSG
jgi:aspartate/tyrosine/aromatic aminotransferase